MRVTVVQCCSNHEPLEGLSHKQHANEFNSRQDHVDGGRGKRECEIETGNYMEVLQLSSGFSQDAAKCSENSKNSKDSNADLTASNANVSQQKNGYVESNDRSQVHAEEEEKRDTVSDLVNAWNNSTAEVLDV